MYSSRAPSPTIARKRWTAGSPGLRYTRVAEGDKIPRKGGPGIMRSDLLVINKIDLAPHVGADLAVMERDAKRMRGDRPFVFTNLRDGTGADAIVDWMRHALLFES